ncbi:major latex protein 15-like [Papaver somniferum]|uniref:major latex protein 15-like n=1 Tax=Papaver somniferum TaxID=3469 RepID=UPI000E6FC03C|nr:major latex protein 15-like [Papaver somniferum]
MAQHHTISGLVGKLVTESEVNCDANEYYKIGKHHEEVPTASPHVSDVKVIEGHGTTSGRIKQWNITVAAGRNECNVEKTTYNDETRTICHINIDGDIMKKHKKFDVILVVTPKANGLGSIVTWTIEYEKINEGSPVPIYWLGFLQSLIEDLDSHICTSQ